jgi:integrase
LSHGEKNKRLSEITQADIKTLHTRIGTKLGTKRGKFAANHALILLSGMFSKSAKDLGFDLRNNPARGIPRFAEKGRDRVLRLDEVQSLMKAIDSAEPTMRDFIKMALFTGARRSNVLAMKWDDVSIERATWKVPGEVTKSGDPLIVSLAPQVVEILKQRPEYSPYVFPAMRMAPKQVEDARRMRDAGATTRAIAEALAISQTAVCRVLKASFKAEEPRHLSPPKTAWESILKAAGIAERTTIHDLRRTFATALINTGASLTVVAAAMGHKDIRTTQKHYAFASTDTVKNATIAGVNSLTGLSAA